MKKLLKVLAWIATVIIVSGFLLFYVLSKSFY